MNGAIAELCPRMIRAPIRNRLTTIGTSHHRLLRIKNESSSPATPMFRALFRMNFMISPRLGTGADEPRSQVYVEFRPLSPTRPGQLLPDVTQVPWRSLFVRPIHVVRFFRMVQPSVRQLLDPQGIAKPSRRQSKRQ